MLRIKEISSILLVIFALTGCSSNQNITHVTHMGQPTSEHVTLEVVGGMNEGCGRAKSDFLRVLPDGNIDNGARRFGYRVPAGKVLVITDVDWQFVHPDHENAAGKIEVLRLFIENLKEPMKKRRVFESAITLSSLGEGGISESLTSGFMVSSAARICPDVSPGPQGPPSGLQHLILRGYLIPEN